MAYQLARFGLCPCKVWHTKPAVISSRSARVDLLRLHHERIEAWGLEQAGVKFDPKAEPGKLEVAA